MLTFVVPVDGSAFADSAVDVARAAARAQGGSVCLLRVSVAEHADAALHHLGIDAAAIKDVPVSTSVIVQDPGTSVAECIDRAVVDLGPDAVVCMAAHGRSTLGTALLGSTTEALLRRHRRPVLVVGRHCAHPWSVGSGLLIPIDGSVAGDVVLPEAARTARSWRLDPWLLQVVHPYDPAAGEHLDTGLDRARARLTELGVEPKTNHEFSSDAATAISEQARVRGATLIIMMSAMRTGVGRILMGSVTMGVIHDAHCPVLVVPRTMADEAPPLP